MKASKIKSICATLVMGLALALSFAGSWENSVAASPEKKDTTPGKKTGKDYTGQNCEHKTGPESSTFGKCENVCGDQEITGKDRVNNRWVCGGQPDTATPPSRVVGRGKVTKVGTATTKRY